MRTSQPQASLAPRRKPSLGKHFRQRVTAYVRRENIFLSATRPSLRKTPALPKRLTSLKPETFKILRPHSFLRNKKCEKAPQLDGKLCPNFLGTIFIVRSSGTRVLSCCFAAGASKLFAALLVARLVDGRTATLTYSHALPTVEELSAGVYIDFYAIALMR
jgi:hypothetical protein